MKHQTNISSDTVTSDTYKKISKNQKWIKGIYSFRITGATLAQWMSRKPHVARPKSGGLGSNPIPAPLLHIFFIFLTLLSSVSVFTASLSKRGKNKQTKNLKITIKKVFELS